jgi:hypothetical protein
MHGVSRDRKGQAEYIVLVGIILVIAVISYFALSTGSIFPKILPPGIEQEKKLVEDSVTNVGRQGADLAIQWLEQQGGYLTPDLSESVIFTQVAVPYWQKCGTAMIPEKTDIRDRLQTSVKNYILNSLLNKSDYFGKNVTFDLQGMYVQANMLDNKIDFSVYMPTTIQGHSIPQPYTFSVPTRFGEIYEFGKRFAQENAQNRFLDHFTINTIYFSGDLETQGVLTQCGQGIYQSGPDIEKGLENVITYTLANTIWWQPMPSADDESKMYAIESVGGMTYDHLDIGFYLPDDFDLQGSFPMHMTNADSSAAAPIIFIMPVCFAPYNWKYSVDYPVIVRVRDDLTGHHVNFVVLVDVDEMMPGDCSPFIGVGSLIDRNCSARIKVIGRDGQPIENVSATFGRYYIGESGEDGIIAGPISCGNANLTLNQDGYGLHTLERTIQNINSTYTLFKTPTFDMNFRQVDISSEYRIINVGMIQQQIHLYDQCEINPTTNQILTDLSSTRGDFFITNIDPDNSNYDCLNSQECQTCRTTMNSADCNACITSCQINVKPFTIVDYVPGDVYQIDTEMWDFSLIKAMGGFDIRYNIQENNQTYYMYVPTKSMPYISDSDKNALTRDIRIKCQIEPIDTIEHTGIIRMVIGCSCAELQNMVSSEMASCLNPTERNALFSGGCNVNNVKDVLRNKCGYEVIGTCA